MRDELKIRGAVADLRRLERGRFKRITDEVIEEVLAGGALEEEEEKEKRSLNPQI